MTPAVVRRQVERWVSDRLGIDEALLTAEAGELGAVIVHIDPIVVPPADGIDDVALVIPERVVGAIAAEAEGVTA